MQLFTGLMLVRPTDQPSPAATAAPPKTTRTSIRRRNVKELSTLVSGYPIWTDSSFEITLTVATR